MFTERSLPDDVAAVRAAHAPDCLVLDASADFETIPPAAAEDLGLLVESLDPATYPSEWLPDDAPALLVRYAGSDFTIGMPGDGTVVWTRQTVPPTVVAKKRAEGTPEEFLDFLFAEAFVQIGLDVPEQFLPFFGEHYRELDRAVPLGPSDVYQVAAALYEAWVGLQTREVFREWADDSPRLHEAWVDAGERLEGRLADLPTAVAHGETSFPEATEFACSAIKHDLELPAPFAALDTAAYVEYGPDYAVQWAEKTFAQLVDD
ncbi:hypothetical protein SAMN04487948_103445 [Halogranum amylolyticum]|uniref:Uncharacterized protein n=1 Tax=Halogranum amylolyticum TaxID=660520 RepID=A0A1H8R257_9EURY|nr:hypothetical protein [Halogranum amylolyticum]SEO60377.1 hypothetical protein SAMN04487948_103445 [Halogranum amylolyticum]